MKARNVIYRLDRIDAHLAGVVPLLVDADQTHALQLVWDARHYLAKLRHRIDADRVAKTQRRRKSEGTRTPAH